MFEAMTRPVDRSIARYARLRTLIAVIGATSLAAFGIAIVASGSADARAHIRRCPYAITSARRAPTGVIRRAVTCLINDQRIRHGLPILHGSGRLNNAAQHWADAMVGFGTLTHGTNLGARISSTGFAWSTVGEDIGSGYGTPRQIVRAWMHSTVHCQIILDPSFRDVGTGVSRHPIRGYARRGATWTEDFALPRGARAPSGNWGPANGCPY